jgi:seryl-tRNA synthetase
LQGIQAEIDTIVMGLPNIPHESVPAGNSEEDNVEVSKWGEPGQYDFEVKDHVCHFNYFNIIS